MKAIDPKFKQYTFPGATIIGQGLHTAANAIRRASNRFTTWMIRETYHKGLIKPYTLAGMLSNYLPNSFGPLDGTEFLALPGTESVVSRFLAGSGKHPLEAEVGPFSNGERYVRLNQPVDNRTVVIFQEFDGRDINDVFFETLVAVDAVKKSSAAKVVVVLPSLPYIDEKPASVEYEVDYFKLMLNILFRAAEVDVLVLGNLVLDRKTSFLFLQDIVTSRFVAPWIDAESVLRFPVKTDSSHAVCLIPGSANRGQAGAVIGGLMGREALSESITDVRTARLPGKRVIIFQTCRTGMVNTDLMEAFLLAYTASKQGAREVFLVMPFIGYFRQERIAKRGEPISAQLLLHIFARSAGVSRFITYDPHSPTVAGFIKEPMEMLTAFPVLVAEVRKDIPRKHFLAGAADAGGAKQARRLAVAVTGLPNFAVADKSRPGRQQVEMSVVTGTPVKGKAVAIIEDMIDTGSTILAAAKTFMDLGARSVSVYAVHPVFSIATVSNAEAERIRAYLIGEGRDPNDFIMVDSATGKIKVHALIRLQADGNIKRVVVTDTIPVDPKYIIDESKVRVVPMAETIASDCATIIRGEELPNERYLAG